MRKIIWICFVAAPVVAQLQGIVVDRNTQAPIEGAIVRIQKQEPTAVTDVNGFFSLNDTAPFSYLLTAAAYNYFNGFVQIDSVAGTVGIVIELDTISTTVVDGHPLHQPEDCINCHPNQYAEWENSPMRKTGLNTWVFDLYDGMGTPGGMNGFVYQRDSIHRVHKPNSDCSACHSPVHWLTDIQTAGMGNINNPNIDMDNGVQCEVCHRAYDVNIDKINFPGVDPNAFTLLRGPQHLEFGFRGDATYENFIMRPAYNPQLSAQLCGACHEDNVDHDDDDDYEDEGSVPHETTFSEWQQYQTNLGAENAATCIECHMPTTPETQYCVFVEDRPAFTIRNHNIRGTTPEFLENALTMDVSHDQTIDEVSVDVSIANDLTGHAVPTGVMIRNMILLVLVTDENGQPLTQTAGGTVDVIGGVGDPDDGFYAGLAGQSFYKNMTDGTNEGIFYTEAVGIASDNRIQPGTSYQDSLRFSLGGTPPKNVNVDVKLIYRRSYRYILEQKGWTETGHGEPLADIAPPHFGHLMERTQFTVDVCAIKDLDNSLAIDGTDLSILMPQWLGAAPFCATTDPITNMKHFVSLINCL